MYLSMSAQDVLRACTVHTNIVKLPPRQLDRDVYEEVNECFMRLGGTWKRGKGHVFTFYDPAPLVQAVQESGIMPPKNPTAFFPTPDALISLMLAEFGDFSHESRFLEPSAGMGAIAARIRSDIGVEPDVCEILDLNRHILQQKGFRVVAEDFLSYQPEEPYDGIVMNPPFSLEGDSKAYITHIMHAYGMLKESGRLVAIVPSGFAFSTDTKTKNLRTLVSRFGYVHNLPDQAFKASGTGVQTLMIVLDKMATSWRDQPYNGWDNWYQWNLFLMKDTTPARMQDYDRLIHRGVQGESIEHDVLAFFENIMRDHPLELILWDEHNQQLVLRNVARDVAENSK